MKKRIKLLLYAVGILLLFILSLNLFFMFNNIYINCKGGNVSNHSGIIENSNNGSIIISSGEYECEKDIDTGIYDISVAYGKGLVYCDKKINTLMGIGDIEKYKVNLKGVNLEKGDILTVTDTLVIVLLSS